MDTWIIRTRWHVPSVSVLTGFHQEIIKVREVIPHTGPIPIVIPLRLFLDDINFPADVTARVTWKSRSICTMPLSVFKIEFHGLIKFIVARYRFQTYILGIA